MLLDWLTMRPIAHRGLHDASTGVIENTPSAFQAAVAGQYGIECDVQLTADGEAIVHHDEALGRVTAGQGRLADMTVSELRETPFLATADRMMTLGELCDLVGGRTPLVIEIKSQFDRDHRLVRRVANILNAYRGPVAAMSFDPVLVAALRRFAPALTRGIVAEQNFRPHDDSEARGWTSFRLGQLLHAPRSKPNFIAYRVADLPTLATTAARLFGVPLLTWTVRTPEERARAARYADQMIFEGFRA